MWRIYYADGSTFDSNEGAPSDSPPLGVVALCVRRDCDHHPTAILKPEPRQFEGGALSANFFVWRPDVEEWLLAADIFGVLRQAIEHGPILVREGIMVPHRDWERIWQRAASDPDFA